MSNYQNLKIGRVNFYTAQAIIMHDDPGFDVYAADGADCACLKNQLAQYTTRDRCVVLDSHNVTIDRVRHYNIALYSRSVIREQMSPGLGHYLGFAIGHDFISETHSASHPATI